MCHKPINQPPRDIQCPFDTAYSFADDGELMKPGNCENNASSFIELLATGQPPIQPTETMDRPTRSAPGDFVGGNAIDAFQ